MKYVRLVLAIEVQDLQQSLDLLERFLRCKESCVEKYAISCAFDVPQDAFGPDWEGNEHVR
jgi:hypothetical protein